MKQQEHPYSFVFLRRLDGPETIRIHASALKAYEKGFAIRKSGPIALKIQQALIAGGNPVEADARIFLWLKDQPADVGVRTHLAESYLQAGKNRQATEQYELLLQTDPTNGRALNNLAWLCQQQKDPRTLATAERGYRLDPDNPDMMDTFGWILVEQGNISRGLELLKRAAERTPASTTILYHRAVALAKAGDKTQARRELADLLAKNKKFPERLDAQALLRQL